VTDDQKSEIMEMVYDVSEYLGIDADQSLKLLHAHFLESEKRQWCELEDFTEQEAEDFLNFVDQFIREENIV